MRHTSTLTASVLILALTQPCLWPRLRPHHRNPARKSRDSAHSLGSGLSQAAYRLAPWVAVAVKRPARRTANGLLNGSGSYVASLCPCPAAAV